MSVFSAVERTTVSVSCDVHRLLLVLDKSWNYIDSYKLGMEQIDNQSFTRI